MTTELGLQQKEGWIPKDERKKILLLSDDLRMPSGVGVMSKELVVGTAHKYNWVQLGAAVHHPEAGKGIDVSDSTEKEFGIKDPYVRVFPYNGYGDPNILRWLLLNEKPDAIMHFTDPRFWGWLYNMEHELRQSMPIMYYHVWDDIPFPRYNENFYRSCDAIFNISKQTHNIVRQVWKKDAPEPWQVKYIPHGVDHKVWKKLTNQTDIISALEMRKNMFGEEVDKIKFVVLYNNRNIRRKMPGDVILTYREFIKGLPEAERDGCRLLMHTQPVDENGTDLLAILRDLAPEVKVVFSPERIGVNEMVKIYYNSDVVVNMASNEGFGLGTLEAIMSEKMIIANVTGGLQDQMGFTNEAGEYLDPEIEFNSDWGSNSDGKYRNHGEWVLPAFPSNRALIGSPATPYIFDDRCSYEDVAKRIREVYDMTPEERARRGALGREYAMNPKVGMTGDAMADKFIESIDATFANWKPRKRFGIYKAS